MHQLQGFQLSLRESWERTALTTTSTPFSTFESPIRFAILVAKLVVSSVVVLLNVSHLILVLPCWISQLTAWRTLR